MLRKLYLTSVFLLFSHVCFSQAYRINFLTYDGSNSCGQTTTGYADDLRVIARSSGKTPIGYRLVEIGQATEDGQTCSFDSSKNVNLTASQSLCGIFDFRLDGCCDSEDGTFRIIPDNNFEILTPRPTVGNTVPSITLEATPGYHELVYNWMYFDIVSTSWKQFPSRFLGESSITFTAEDLFGNNASNYINKSIQYKLELCNGWSPMSSPYIYNLIYPSPELSSITTKKTRCSYTTDGGFKINVNRNLSTGETLVITLYDAVNNALVGQEFTTTLTNNGNGSYGYTWQANLDPINYKLKYQTHNSNSGISPNDPTWDSLVFSQIFTIGKSQQVDFSITDTSDETCFMTNDGFIKIQASGESGRTFLYQYLKNGTIQIIGGQSWLPFTNTNIAEINSLGLGNYRVRVRDSEGCLVK